MIGARIIQALGLLGLFSLLLACAPKARVSTIGEVEVRTFCIKKEKKGENPLLDKLVEDRLRKNLKVRNFEVSPTCGDYVLHFDYGVTPRQIYVPKIVYGTSEVFTFVAYRFEEGKAIPEIYTVIPPPATYYREERETLYVHWLVLRLERGGEPVWVGEISIEDYAPDIRAHIDALAGKLLDFFGKDTKRTIEVEIR